MRKFIGKKNNDIISVHHPDDVILKDKFLFYTYSTDSDIIAEELKNSLRQEFVELSNTEGLEIQLNTLASEIINQFLSQVDRVTNLFFDDSLPSREHKFLLNNKYLYHRNPWILGQDYYVTALSIQDKSFIIEDDCDNQAQVSLDDVDVVIVLAVTKELQKVQTTSDICLF